MLHFFISSFVSYNDSGAMQTVSTSNVFISNSWTNLAVTYSNASDTLTVYVNATVSELSNALLCDDFFPLKLMHICIDGIGVSSHLDRSL